MVSHAKRAEDFEKKPSRRGGAERSAPRLRFFFKIRGPGPGRKCGARGHQNVEETLGFQEQKHSPQNLFSIVRYGRNKIRCFVFEFILKKCKQNLENFFFRFFVVNSKRCVVARLFCDSVCCF